MTIREMAMMRVLERKVRRFVCPLAINQRLFDTMHPRKTINVRTRP